MQMLPCDHLYSMLKHFYPDRSGRFQDNNVPIHRALGVADWFGVWKWCESYAMAFHSHQISTELSTSGRFWTDLLDSALHHRQQNTKYGNIFRISFIPPVEFRDLYFQCQGALKLFWKHVVAQHLTKTVYVGFSFNLSPVCIISQI